MANAGLDSSYLSPFLPEPDLDPPYVYPPAEIVDLDPHSEEYFQKLVAALDLDTESYAHVDPTIMTRFKDLIRKYAHAFYLPGTTNITPLFFVFVPRKQFPLISLLNPDHLITMLSTCCLECKLPTKDLLS